MNPALRHSSAHVFVRSIEAPALDDADVHHLTRVLRLRPGAAVTASDGRGSWAPCVLAAGGAVETTGEVVRTAPPVERLTIAAATPKGDRPELIVQKLTEIGIDRIVFVDTVRSVVRWDEPRAQRQLDRLRRIAREAAMQCRRVWLPEIDGVLALSEVLVGRGAAVAEPGGRPLGTGDTTVAVGPEGGFDPDELPPSVERVDLGPTILRVETAAIVAATLMAAAYR